MFCVFIEYAVRKFLYRHAKFNRSRCHWQRHNLRIHLHYLCVAREIVIKHNLLHWKREVFIAISLFTHS